MSSGLNTKERLRELREQADIHEETGQNDALLAVLTRIIALDPSDLGAHLDQIKILRKLSQYTDANASIEQLLPKIESHSNPLEQPLLKSRALYLRARTFQERGEGTDIIQALEAINASLNELNAGALADNPSEAKKIIHRKALMFRSGIYNDLQRYQDSLADIDTALMQYPSEARERLQIMRRFALDKLTTRDSAADPITPASMTANESAAAPASAPSLGAVHVFLSPTAAGAASGIPTAPRQQPPAASQPAPTAMLNVTTAAALAEPAHHDDKGLAAGATSAGFTSP